MARKPLEHWLRLALNDPDKARIKAIGLVHMEGTSQKELHTIKFAEGRTYKIEDLANLLRDRATLYCQDIPGVQTFQALAFYDDSEEPQDFQPFIVSGQTDNHGLSTEPPTKEGQTMQEMRHREVLTQAMMRERAQLLENFTKPMEMTLKLVDRLSDRLAKSEATEVEALMALKSVLVENTAEQTAAELKLAEYHRKTEERKILFRLGGPILNRITGREIVPQSTEPDMLSGLQSILPPEIAGLVSHRMKKALEAKREAKELAAKVGDETEEDAKALPEHKAAE